MRITVNTTEFENSHGRKPRGHGYWGFRLSGGMNDGREFWATDKYSAAKGQALAKAEWFRYDTVTVLP